MGTEYSQDVVRVALRLTASYAPSNLGNPSDPLDDLVYLLLSGQTNETLYQSTFKALKAAFPTWAALAAARVPSIAKVIAKGGLSKQKAVYLKAIVRKVKADFGQYTLKPLCKKTTDEAETYLTKLPGVGIKVARCVLMYTLHREVFPADVHCLRIMERLGWLEWKKKRADSLADTAQDLVPEPLRRALHVGLVQHGREVCTEKSPACDRCCLRDLCPHPKETEERPTVVDLCCGAGGFSWGFMQAGFNVLLGVDDNPYALATFNQNIPSAKVLNADVCERTTLREIKRLIHQRHPTVVIAGPPCQGFSRAGPRVADDPRNAVLKGAIRLAVKLKPQVIVFENVLNLRGQSFVHHLRRAMGVVRRAGYRFERAVVRAEAFAVPQSRQRIILMASRVGSREDLLHVLNGLENRELVRGMTVAAAFAGLPADPAQNGHIANHDVMIHSAKVRAKIGKIKPGEGPLSYRKLDPNAVASTLVCGHRALPCHYAARRTITTREAARVQSFPDDFVFVGPRGSQMLQVANAVPPKLALGTAMAVLDLLRQVPDDAVKSLLASILERLAFAPEPGSLATPAHDRGHAR
jgi:DNA (cytosine-5)-methyltransferase 1